MSQFRIDPALFATFPDTLIGVIVELIGVIVARQIQNQGEQAEALAALRTQVESLQGRITGDLIEHPHIAVWRSAYQQFGVKPKKYPSSIENLVRRVLNGYTIGHINTLVDLYNQVSLKYLLPVGGEDLDQTQGDIVLRFAGDSSCASPGTLNPPSNCWAKPMPVHPMPVKSSTPTTSARSAAGGTGKKLTEPSSRRRRPAPFWCWKPCPPSTTACSRPRWLTWTRWYSVIVAHTPPATSWRTHHQPHPQPRPPECRVGVACPVTLDVGSEIVGQVSDELVDWVCNVWMMASIPAFNSGTSSSINCQTRSSRMRW